MLLGLLRSKLMIVIAGVGIALVAGLAITARLYSAEVAEGATREALIDRLREDIASSEAALELSRELVERRARERELAEKSAAVWKNKWREVQQNDDACKKWAETNIPACAIEQLFKRDSSKEGGDRASPRTSIANFRMPVPNSH